MQNPINNAYDPTSQSMRVNTSSTVYDIVAYYDTTDLTYDFEYYAEAEPLTLETEKKWRCFRIKNTKAWAFISKKYAWKRFNNLWDETTVKSLNYWL